MQSEGLSKAVFWGIISLLFNWMGGITLFRWLPLFSLRLLFLPAKERHNPYEGFHLYRDYLHYDGDAHYLDHYPVTH